MHQNIKSVYIASPYRARRNAVDPFAEIESNIRFAEHIGKEVASKGYAAIVPHMLYPHWDSQTNLSDEYFLASTLKVMMGADILLMEGGFDRSTGAIEELRVWRESKDKNAIYFGVGSLPMSDGFNP